MIKAYLLYCLAVIAAVIWIDRPLLGLSEKESRQLSKPAPFRSAVNSPIVAPKANIRASRAPWSIPFEGGGRLAVDSSGVYVNSGRGLFAYGLDGKFKWRFSPGGLGGTPPALGPGSQILLGIDNGTVFCLDPWTGKPVWSIRIGSSLRSAPVWAGEAVYAVAGEGKRSRVVKLDSKSGAVRWQSEALAGEISASPAYDQESGQVGVGTRTGGFVVFDAANGTPSWSRESFDSIWAQAATFRGKFYVHSYSGHLYALDAKTGDSIFDVNLKGSITEPPQVTEGAKNRATIVSYLSDGIVSGTDSHNGRVLWRRNKFSHLGDLSAPPVMWQGALYFLRMDPERVVKAAVDNQ